VTEQAESRTFKDASYDEQQAVREGFAGFLKDGSLYQNHTLQILPDEFAQIRPEMLHLYCGRCKRENPFRSPEFRDAKLQSEADIGRDIYGEHPRETTHKKALKSRVYVVMLECTACKREQFTCWIEIDTDKKRARKIGQAPEPSVDVPPDVKEALGDDERLYRRARVCLNFSYGVAACAYLRRILENRIDPFLGIVRSMREDDGADEAELARIDEIARCKVASEKIRLAGEVLPNSLKMEGDNILLLLHDQLSYGIHSGDEDWCGEVHELPARPKLRARRAGGGAEEERGPQGGRGGRQDVQAREDREGAG
jgi:ribosomal protein L44E